MSTKKRQSYSLETKLEILTDVDNREEHDKIVQKYRLKQTQITQFFQKSN